MKSNIPANNGRRFILLIGLIAMSVLSAMAYSYHSSEKMILKYTPLIDATMEIKLEDQQVATKAL